MSIGWGAEVGAHVNAHAAYRTLDLIGTFAFAISGAVAARQRRLDLLGILVVTFIVACGGGIMRDVCIGATPPAGLSDWVYLAVTALAALLVLVAYPTVRRLRHPVLFFDAIGLGLFAVAGAQKAWVWTQSAETAIVLGMVSAVGGGVLRDMLLSRVPAILEREIYASAALLGATLQIGLMSIDASSVWTPWIATTACVLLRLASLQFGWRLPAFRTPETRRKTGMRAQEAEDGRHYELND
ncbi:protein of unknown function UPF0126 [Burkholderia cepacia GG4]|uniref:Glycine transporter domain-containing protein n=1 Tax=Burkholderia cepacia GG4 TaxID=1009846 RepID=A0A9W3K4P7_BURCE|nr:protein of unknown function UPF0126 [Burkholderia cepacia GG4]